MHPLVNFLDQSCMNMNFSHMVSVLVFILHSFYMSIYIVTVSVIASIVTYFLTPLAHIVLLLSLGFTFILALC